MGISKIKPALDYLGLQLNKLPRFKNTKGFKTYLITCLKIGIMFSYRYWPKNRNDGHSFLMTHYNEKTDLFRVIDAGIHSKNTIEFVSIRDIMNRNLLPIFGDESLKVRKQMSRQNTFNLTKAILPKGIKMPCLLALKGINKDITIKKIFSNGDLSVRAFNVCKSLNLKTIKDLHNYVSKHKDFMNVKYPSKKTNQELLYLCTNAHFV